MVIEINIKKHKELIILFTMMGCIKFTHPVLAANIAELEFQLNAINRSDIISGDYDEEIVDYISSNRIPSLGRRLLFNAVLASRKSTVEDLVFLVDLFVGISQSETWKKEILISRRSELRFEDTMYRIAKRISFVIRYPYVKLNEDEKQLLNRDPIGWLITELNTYMHDQDFEYLHEYAEDDIVKTESAVSIESQLVEEHEVLHEKTERDGNGDRAGIKRASDAWLQESGQAVA